MEFKINLALVFIIYKKAYWRYVASLMVSLKQYWNSPLIKQGLQKNN